MKTLATVVAILAIADTASAVDYSTSANDLEMRPFAGEYDGTLESMTSLSICVGDSFPIVDVDVVVRMSHGRAGNLVWKLQSPAGTIVDLVSRPGLDEPADDGSGCCGEPSDLILGNTYEIDDSACTSSEMMARTTSHSIDSFRLHSSGFMNEFGLTTLNGEDSLGTWTLYVGQAQDQRTGIFDGFTLQLPRTLPDRECIRSSECETTLRVVDGQHDLLPPGVQDGDPFHFFVDYAPSDGPVSFSGCVYNFRVREWKLSLGASDYGRCHLDGLGSLGSGILQIRGNDPEFQDRLGFSLSVSILSPPVNEFLVTFVLQDVDDGAWECIDRLPSELSFEEFDIVRVEVTRIVWSRGRYEPVTVAVADAPSFALVNQKLEGDADGDCRISLDDILAVLTQWGECRVIADVDGNGDVGHGDILTVLVNWANWSCTDFGPG